MIAQALHAGRVTSCGRQQQRDAARPLPKRTAM